MGDYSSKYSLNQEIKFMVHSTIFLGKVIGISFTERGTFYDINVSGNVYKGILEKVIES